MKIAFRIECPRCHSHKLAVAYTARTNASIKFNGNHITKETSEIVIGSEFPDHCFCEDCGSVLPPEATKQIFECIANL
jgi:hypothetical protein